MARRIPVIAVFDIGKTNKKVLLFNDTYQVVYEYKTRLKETVDDDGEPCENVTALTRWVKRQYDVLRNHERYAIKAIHASTYGASFVYIDDAGKLTAPLYNYLKSYPPLLQKKLHKKYEGVKSFSTITASPSLGSLNSGLQLYRYKQEKKTAFEKIKYALHLPQYISFILTGKAYSDITSIGCHTALWDFKKNTYHKWVVNEGISKILAPLVACNIVAGYTPHGIPVGVGLHDSSAALIPYFSTIKEPFILLSTGTWCISLNPFNKEPLTTQQLEQDCLCYLSFEGNAVKASRLFAGQEHEDEIKRLATHFKKNEKAYLKVPLDKELASNVVSQYLPKKKKKSFASQNVSLYKTYAEAYYNLLASLIARQVDSTNLILNNSIKTLYVDGGFSHNPVYMYMLKCAYPHLQIYSATVAQATALGAALAMHEEWNKKKLPTSLIESKEVYKK